MTIQRTAGEKEGVLAGVHVHVLVPLFQEPGRVSSADDVDYNA